MMTGIEVLRPDTLGTKRTMRPIDMMHLAKQALGDPGIEGEILRTFDQISSVHFDGLEASTTVPELLHHLHILRGAAVGVGAWSLAEHAHVMETELKAGESVNPERVDDIHMAIEELHVFIAERLAHEADETP